MPPGAEAHAPPGYKPRSLGAWQETFADFSPSGPPSRRSFDARCGPKQSRAPGRPSSTLAIKSKTLQNTRVHAFIMNTQSTPYSITRV